MQTKKVNFINSLLPVIAQVLALTKSPCIITIFCQANKLFVRATKLTASDGTTNDNFGSSVSLSNDYAVIGAEGDSSNQGSIYVFVRSGSDWSQQAEIVASDGAAGDKLGCSVSIDADYIAAGAYQDTVTASLQGSAYVFILNGNSWDQQAQLVASDAAANDFFGYSVSIYSDKALVGAYGDDIGGNIDQGSAYIFIRSGTSWSQQAQLIASDGASNDFSGYSVSLSSDYGVSGAYQKNNGPTSFAGAAFVFLRAGSDWSQLATLVASDGEEGDEFGFSVSIDGDYVLSGSPYHDANGNSNQGSAYMFFISGSTVTQQAKLVASDGAANDHFGSSCNINGDYAIIGATYDDSGSSQDLGSAYVFLLSGADWTQQAKLTASDEAASDLFAWSVSLYSDYAVIGSLGDDVNGNTNQGSAYLYYRNDVTWSFACESGTYISGSTCTDCDVGTYNGLVGQSSCTECPAGTYNPDTASTSVSSCVDCAAGSYADVTGSAACSNCPTGKYNPDTGSSSFSDCINCPQGTYNPDSASTSESDCTDCAAGKYNPDTGSSDASECTDCAAGSYSSEAAAGFCTGCPAGTFGTSLGATSSSTCMDCDAGTYSSSSGSSSCTNCVAGKYQSEPASTGCDDCASDEYSNKGSTSCSGCGDGKEVNADQSGCDTLSFLESDPGGAVALTVVLSFGFGALAMFGWYKYKTKGRRYDKKSAPLLDQEMTRDEIIAT